jgi:hypothetical protein
MAKPADVMKDLDDLGIFSDAPPKLAAAPEPEAVQEEEAAPAPGNLVEERIQKFNDLSERYQDLLGNIEKDFKDMLQWVAEAKAAIAPITPEELESGPDEEDDGEEEEPEGEEEERD